MRTQIYCKGSVNVNGKEYNSIPPVYKTGSSAGADLAAPHDFEILPGQIYLMDTGLIIKVPRKFYLGIYSRSGVALKKRVVVANGVGIVDSDYYGPEDTVKVALLNQGDEPVQFQRGDRVAQCILQPFDPMDFDEQDDPNFGKSSSRGGFGSTGWNG